MSGAERAAYLVRLADGIRKRLPLLAQLWTAQVGAPIIFANHLIHAGESRYDYFAELAGTYKFEDRRPTPRGHAHVRREPVGVAALIAPWNATFNIFAHKIPSSLAAGCTTVLKSPPESPLDALLVAESAEAAGVPPGVVNVISADRDEAARLVASPQVENLRASLINPSGNGQIGDLYPVAGLFTGCCGRSFVGRTLFPFARS